jgi:hypothetical protein
MKKPSLKAQRFTDPFSTEGWYEVTYESEVSHARTGEIIWNGHASNAAEAKSKATECCYWLFTSTK